MNAPLGDRYEEFLNRMFKNVNFMGTQLFGESFWTESFQFYLVYVGNVSFKDDHIKYDKYFAILHRCMIKVIVGIAKPCGLKNVCTFSISCLDRPR